MKTIIDTPTTRPLAERTKNYRLLAPGEIIQLGDEHYDDRRGPGWFPVATGGMEWDEELFRPIRREIPHQLADERAELIRKLDRIVGLHELGLFGPAHKGVTFEGSDLSEILSSSRELLNHINS